MTSPQQTRRELLRVGGLSLFGGLGGFSVPRLLQAAGGGRARPENGSAKSSVETNSSPMDESSRRLSAKANL